MKKIILLIIFSFIYGCANGTYSSRDGDNSDLVYDTTFCKSLARSKHPGYICKNPLMCTLEETNIVINEITQFNAVFQNCMLARGYNYDAH